MVSFSLANAATSDASRDGRVLGAQRLVILAARLDRFRAGEAEPQSPSRCTRSAAARKCPSGNASARRRFRACGCGKGRNGCSRSNSAPCRPRRRAYTLPRNAARPARGLTRPDAAASAAHAAAAPSSRTESARTTTLFFFAFDHNGCFLSPFGVPCVILS